MYIIYITSPSKEEALSISRTLIDEGLAACTNIFSDMTSVYKWEGKIQQSSEFILIVKTTKSLVNAAEERIKELHSYKCPCIMSIKIDNCDKDFLKWVETSTKLPY